MIALSKCFKGKSFKFRDSFVYEFEKNKLEVKVLLEIRTINHSNSNFSKLCLIVYGNKQPKLEKRNWFIKNENLNMGKMESFDKDDFLAISKNPTNVKILTAFQSYCESKTLSKDNSKVVTA